MVILPGLWETIGVPKQVLRIIAHGYDTFAVCERCNAQFRSTLLNQHEAEKEIRAKYDEHKCKTWTPAKTLPES
jgi:hypothetical protein